MSNPLSMYVKKKVVGRNQNLVSLDEPYQTMKDLIGTREVRVIIDAGASNARISRRLLSHYPGAHVHAFEPNQTRYREVLDQLAREEPRFHAHYVALSDHVGQADLHITESPGATSLLSHSDRMLDHGFSGTSVERVEQVPLTTIDVWADAHAPDGVDLMKFDIQGAELQALQGAGRVLSASTLLIYIEIWFNPVYEGSTILPEIDTLMRGYGFVLYDLFKPRYSAKGMILWANAVYAHARRLGLA